MEARLSETPYRWLQSQFFLEKATCHNAQVELQKAAVEIARSLDIAERSHFPVLILRNIAISAGIKYRQLKYDEAWKTAVSGLGNFWQGTYPAERLEQLYAVMWQCAKESDSLHAAQALLQHTLDMRLDPHGGIKRNFPVEDLLHSSMANIYTALKEDELAKEETRKASSSQKEPTEKSGNYRLFTEIEAADLRLAQGDAEFALSRLIPVGELLKTAQDGFINLSYFRVLGDTYLQLKH